eukprot:15343118-Ditylum_brightwellii.AAC.1
MADVCLLYRCGGWDILGWGGRYFYNVRRMFYIAVGVSTIILFTDVVFICSCCDWNVMIWGGRAFRYVRRMFF